MKQNGKSTGLKTTDDLARMDTHKDETARTLLRHAMGAAREYESVQANLASVMEYCRRQLERAQRELNDEGRVPNSLGILQGNGVEVDRLCGELSRTRQAAEAAQELLATLGIN
jgi:hypothetical protein